MPLFRSRRSRHSIALARGGDDGNPDIAAEPILARAVVSRRILGPRQRATSHTRVVWALVAAACAGVLSVAVYLTPNPAGMGTHEALGMPPCSFVLNAGLPCPTCGMTTSFSNVVRGRLIAAFLAQPAGMVLCIATIILFAYGVYVAVAGWTIDVNWDRIGMRLIVGLGFLILAGWGFKIAYGMLTGVLPVK